MTSAEDTEKKIVGEEVKPEEIHTDSATVVDDPVAQKFKELGLDDVSVIDKIKEQGFKTLELLEGIEVSDLTEAGLDKARARKLIKDFKMSEAAKPGSNAASSFAANAVNTVTFDNVLPQVLPDESLLEALKAGGVLKVEMPAVISAVRAALAHRVGLYGIPDILVKKMEEYADTSEEQVGPEFFKLSEEITRRDYAAIFAAIPGLSGKYVTGPRKELLFKRVDHDLWPAIINFHAALKSWQEAWMQGVGGPMGQQMLLAALMGNSGGVPAGMMAPPDTGAVRDAADEVANAINRVFRGTGVPIASALGWDAKKIKDALMNPELPKMIGAANREMMLKMLGVALPSTYPRLEQNLIRLVLGILQLKDQPAGQAEVQYLTALYMLGATIQWNLLDNSSVGGITGIGDGRKDPFGKRSRET